MPKPKTSYKTIELKIPAHLVDQIMGVTKSQGTWQRPFQRIRDSMKIVGGTHVGRVRNEDIEAMKDMAAKSGEGSYQSWSSEILKLNGY